MDTDSYQPGEQAPPAPGHEPTAAEQVAQEIVDWRTVAGLTRDQVATALGIDASQISRWETGTRIPPYDRVFQLAELFGIEPDARNALLEKALIARRAAELAPTVRRHLASAFATPSGAAS